MQPVVYSGAVNIILMLVWVVWEVEGDDKYVKIIASCTAIRDL